jgi:hypothetical protein
MAVYWRAPPRGAPPVAPAAALAGPLPQLSSPDYLLRPLDALLRITLVGSGEPGGAAAASVSLVGSSAAAAAVPGAGSAGAGSFPAAAGGHVAVAGSHVEAVAGVEAVQVCMACRVPY